VIRKRMPLAVLGKICLFIEEVRTGVVPGVGKFLSRHALAGSGGESNRTEDWDGHCLTTTTKIYAEGRMTHGFPTD
jgi:hypothetical protein